MRMFFVVSIVLLLLLGVLEIYLRFYTSYNEPYFDKQNKIIKRKPNTQGEYKTQYTNSGYFKINNDGWNSHRDYFQRESYSNADSLNSKIRIAIVGHSNIEGLRVPVDKTLSKIFEEDLNRNGISAEVYTFGFGGMHMAQAMDISRYVVSKYTPDILIIGTLSCDFLFENSCWKNFLNLDVKSNGEIEEILPKRFYNESESIFSFLHFCKTFKYLDEKSGIGFRLKRTDKKQTYVQNDSILNLKYNFGADYILKEFECLPGKTQEDILPVFFIKFPDIVPSYNYSFEKVNLSTIDYERNWIENKIEGRNFKIIDLKNTLYDDYLKNKQNFDFKNDYHLNQHAHKVIGEYLSDYFQKYFKQKHEERQH